MNETTRSVLRCQDLSKHYRQGEHDLVVLDGLEFDLRAGERVGIVGASGSGKTTLLNLLGGLDSPSRGQVQIDGRDIATLKPREQDALRNRTLGFVYQFHHLLGEFSALENVAMPLIIAGLPFAACLQRAEALLGEVGLSARLNHKPAQLSGGERQRVAIARALVNEPACVLMDEPTGNLDRHTARAIQALMRELNQRFHTSFVIVTHDPGLAAQMDRVLELRDGRLYRMEASALG